MRKLRLEELKRLSVADYKKAKKRSLVIILDNIRSMHNVGSIFRTADAFRIAKVYLCGITPKPPHREIRKTAIGAEESVDWEAHAYTIQVVQALKHAGYEILSLEQTEGSRELGKFTPAGNKNYAIVLGHEVDGVSQTIIDQSDEVLEIPQYGTKHSLNVSVSAGIALYHICSGMGDL
ncbi:MAG: RNA methyltransferase [Bacteroidota bacterium]